MPEQCKPCPVCNHYPRWFGSQRDGFLESIGCNWERHCPEEGSFDFMTPYLAPEKAIAEWNAAVDRATALTTMSAAGSRGDEGESE